MKESHKLRLAFYELEKNYRPFLDLSVEMQEKYPCFKGAVTLDGYVNYQPDILLKEAGKEAARIVTGK